MKASELPVSIFGETNEGISLMAATRQLRRADHRWREMSGGWQMESEQPSWNLTRDQVHSGRIPAECDTSDKAIMGQGNTGRAYSHA